MNGVNSSLLQITCTISLFFVNFGEISYLLTNKKNINDQEPGQILIGNFIEKGVIDKIMNLQYMQFP